MIKRLFCLTRREYFADFFITPPITLALAALSFHLSVYWMATLLLGVFAWTLYEYVIHRVSHYAPLLRDIHNLHHDDQRAYIAVHPLATLAMYGLFWLAFGLQSEALAVGFSIGYIAYAAAHTLFHYARIVPGSMLFALKRHHALHHTFGEVNFGVTTKIWDKLLGTYRP